MKTLTLVLILALLLSLFSVPAYASSDSGGSWWSGTWGAIRWLGSSLWSMVTSIGNAIKGAITFLLEGLKQLFIPRKDYFTRAFNSIQNAFDKKFGSIRGVAQHISRTLGNIQPSRDMERAFEIRFPRGTLLQGITVNLFKYGQINPLPMFRNVFSGLLVIMTFAFSYRRVIAIIKG